jgi:hypothetical protein
LPERAIDSITDHLGAWDWPLPHDTPFPGTQHYIVGSHRAAEREYDGKGGSYSDHAISPRATAENRTVCRRDG